LNGPAWYRLQPNDEKITLTKKSEHVAYPAKLETGAGAVTVFDPMFELFWEVE